MTLTRDEILEKMKERNFMMYATIGKTTLHFVSDHMYAGLDSTNKDPVINVIVNLETEEFECVYNLEGSFNSLKTPMCGSVMKDDNFDRIVCRFEVQAKWMARLTN